MNKKSNLITFPKAKKLGVLFNQIEDRLKLVALLSDGSYLVLILTRRIYISFVEHYIKLIKQSTFLDKVPVSLRDDFLHMEHVHAMASDEGAQHENNWLLDLDISLLKSQYLIVEINLQIETELVNIGFSGIPLRITQFDEGLDPLSAIALSRSGAHQLLSILVEKGRQANWCFDNQFDLFSNFEKQKLEKQSVN